MGETISLAISGITSNGCLNEVLVEGVANSFSATADGLNALFSATASSPDGFWLGSLMAAGSTLTAFSGSSCSGAEYTGGVSSETPGTNIQIVCSSDGTLAVTLFVSWKVELPISGSEGCNQQWTGSGTLGEPITLTPVGSDLLLSGGTLTVSLP